MKKNILKIYVLIVKYLPSNTYELDSYFLNLSDGEPAFGLGYHGEVAVQHTKKQITKLREKGIAVLSYFIESNNTKDSRVEKNMHQFRNMYGKDAQFIDVKSINEVAKTMNAKFLEINN